MTGLRLIVLNGPMAGTEFPLDGSVIVGRDAANEVTIEDGTISRRHARVSLEGGRIRVRDLGSRNGVRVEGETVREADLAPGDTFAVGRIRIRIAGDAADVPPDDPPESPVLPAAPAASLPRAVDGGLPEAFFGEKDLPAAPGPRDGAGSGRFDYGAAVLGLLLIGVAALAAKVFLFPEREVEPVLVIVRLGMDEADRVKSVRLDRPVARVGPLDPPDLCVVERRTERLLVVKGNRPGEARAWMDLAEGGRRELRVRVEGVPTRDEGDPFVGIRSREDLDRVGREVLAGARQAIEDLRWTEARDLLEATLDALEPYPGSEVYEEADRLLLEVEEAIRERMAHLERHADLLRKQEDWAGLVELAAEMLTYLERGTIPYEDWRRRREAYVGELRRQRGGIGR